MNGAQLGRWQRLRQAVQRVFDPFELRRDEPVPYDWFLPAEVARFDAAVDSTTDNTSRTDDQTWRDLELPRYLAMLSKTLSIFGRQMLYHRLRAGLPSVARQRLVQALQSTQLLHSGHAGHDGQAAIDKAQHILRRVDVEIAGLLFDADLPPAPQGLDHLFWVPLAVLASVPVMLLASVGWGAALLLGALGYSAHVQIKLHAHLRLWHTQKKSLLALLRAAHALAHAGQHGAHPLLAPAAAQQEPVQRLLKLFGPRALERVPALVEYANLLALYQHRRLGTERALLARERSTLQAVFICVANADADLALHAHLSHTQAHGQPTCWPVFQSETAPGRAQLQLVEVVNPLLGAAQPLSLHLLKRSAFFSGQNGVGKSTLLRSVGLNLVVARALGFCYARSAVLPQATVFSSLQIEDSLEHGQSLYVAELQRARQLLQRAEQGVPAVFLIDEIFRGTNHLESVSAAASVLFELAQHGLVLVSSHNLVLAPLLAENFDTLCVARSSADGGLSVSPGVLAHSNGIQMMGELGLPGPTVARAGTVFEWLAGYLTHPQNCPRLRVP